MPTAHAQWVVVIHPPAKTSPPRPYSRGFFISASYQQRSKCVARYSSLYLQFNLARFNPTCPDPTGKRLQTSSLGLSDHKILKEVGRFHIHAPKAPWRQRDTINALRMFILSADGQRRLQVDRGCKRVIRSLKNITYKPGKAEPADNDHSHMSEATAYMAIAIAKGLTPWRVGKSSIAFW